MAKNIASACSSWFGMNQLITLTGQKIVLPFYHVVADEERVHYKYLYPIRSVEDFKEDLDFLVTHFQPISLKSLIELTKSDKKASKPVFHLTFDDGLAEIFTIVAPILKERRIPATFFINTDFLDNKAMFYRFKASIMAEEFSAKGMLDVPYQDAQQIDDFAKTMGYTFDDYLLNQKPYLTSEQIIELINQGFTIGAHSKNHPLYSSLTIDEQVSQTLDSIKVLVEKFQLDYKVFSFPFTDNKVSKDFYNKVNKELDLTFGTAGLKRDISNKNLQRISMEENKKGIQIIKSQYLYYILKSLLGKNSIRRNDG